MYKNNQNFSHQSTAKMGVLLINLGTPDAPDKASLRRYLKEFLADPRVVEVPRAVWWFILNGVILNIRPGRSAKAYQTVWTEQGSPLLIHTQAQADKLLCRLKKDHGGDIIVDFAMRYGNPSISKKLDDMMAKGVRKLLVLPMYPQYSGATTASTFDAIAKDFVQRRWLPDFRFVSHYHDYPAYIKALANKIESFWSQHGRAEKLMFSYHGVPKKYLLKGDPYFCECHKTSRLVAEQLQLSENEYITCFQSRFGREEWLQPYADKTLEALPNQGIKSVQVVCPGFSADCLETIEEMGIENKDVFLNAGGESYQYIDALNSDDEHIEALASLVKDNLSGWTLNLYNSEKSEQLATALIKSESMADKN
ncbi:ferrochelatase [Gayadomonas joobiniege]|uniref:ferrochelatase n=1 Tax=Gayadomonas joobiniege TaxID=1234606 RepID=UPI00037ACFF6|nr:ferrochelatase [Gayadomonas joobiniege]